MTRRPRSTMLFGLGLFACGAAGAANADGEDPVDAVTPYRPSVSNPAQLPTPGQLELEVGGLRSRSPGLTRSSLPYLLKLGFNADWGVLIGGDARIWQHDDSGRAHGAGSTELTLKRAWTVDEETAFGAEWTAELPTGNERVGAGGKANYQLNTILSRDFGSLHLDVNLNGARIGSPDTGAARALFGAAAALGLSVSPHWGVTGELSGTHQGGSGSNGAQLLVALTWSPTKRLTFDLGVARAWRPTPGATQLFGGVVLPIAKLW